MMAISEAAFGFLGLTAGIIVCLVLLFRTHTEVVATKALVETVNGRSLAILAELTEGRRIRKDVPEANRTPREQAYVDLLDRTEREGTHTRSKRILHSLNVVKKSRDRTRKSSNRFKY